jgi:tRNA G18 (ribose-2'-O)-methylase SpoU
MQPVTPLIRIEDAADPRIAEFVAMRDRDLSGRNGLFIAEGSVVLTALADAGPSGRFAIEKLFLLENRVDGLSDLLARLDPGIPRYVAGRAVMDAVVGFSMHRGVLALGRHGPAPDMQTFLARVPEASLVVAAIGLANHDNMGAVMRNAGVFGADAVLIDETCCDPLYRKAIRVSVGAALKVPFATLADEAALFATLDRHGFSQIALSPAGRDDVAGIRRDGRTALWLGSEGHGLTVATMARMRTARIAMSAGFDSLNVATAGAIALHRLWRER